MKFTTLAELIDYFGSEPAPNGTAMLAALRELVDRPLDVERLATAMWDVLYPDPASRAANDNAAEIAAEYALLASPSPEKPR